jgi:integrase
MQKRLTDVMVKNFRGDPERRYEIIDTVVVGLRIRVSPTDVKTWSVMLKVAGEGLDVSRGKNRRISLGKYPLIGLKEAREKAQAAIDQADRGINPAAQKRADIQTMVSRSTRQVVERYIELHAKPNTVKWKETESLLERTVVEEWRDRDLGTVRRADVHALLDDIAASGGVSLAREVRKHLSSLLNWAVDRGFLDVSPMAGMRRPDLAYKARDRVLSFDELSAIWRAADEVGYPFGPLVRLLILTAQRRSEIGELERKHLRDDVIEIPAAAYKTGVDHITPLTSDASAILADLPVWSAGGYLFSTNAGLTPSSGYSKAKQRFDRVVGFSDWTFHDIRRSVASHMAALGVPQEHVERVLGHKIPGIAGVYNKHSYLPERRDALESWRDALMAHLTGLGG